MEKRVAVIDIGSNSVRMMIKVGEECRQVLATTRLGQGVSDRKLQQEPLQRTIQAIGEFCRMAREKEIQTIYAFATSAVRDAENREMLILPVKEMYGVEIDVISGEKEAELAYLGAAGGARVSVMDIGGASTELVAGSGRVERAVSLQTGAVRLKEAFEEDRGAAERFLQKLFFEKKELFAAYSDVPTLGIGGTITTLSAMEQSLEEYDEKRVDGFCLHLDCVQEWADRLWKTPIEQRRYPGLSEKRREIIAHGTSILLSYLRCFDRKEIFVSTGDNLSGYLKFVSENGKS